MHISDLFEVADLTGIVTTTGTEVGPYLLALVSALVVIGVAAALLWKAKRAIVAIFR